MARWGKIKDRGHVEDRRGSRGVALAGGISASTILIVLAVGMIGGQEPALQVLDVIQESQTQYQNQTQKSSEFDGEDSYETFVSTVLGSNNALWERVFANSNLDYTAPKLVLFRQATQSACGGASSKHGPHYCPIDETIYLDETFFDELKSRYGAKGGDVAEAYVIAHEVAHHIQHLIGNTTKVQQIRLTNPSKANDASMRLELQADCIAGIWASSIAGAGVLEKNEISEAIDAAEAVGDDRIQESVYGEIHPETWTHGSSADRKKWFNIGYQYSDFQKCDTFR